MGVLGLGLIGVALLLGSGELDKLGTGGGNGSEIELARDAATDFDPITGGGDGTEHSAEVERVVDGDPAGTAWASETYGLEDFGNKEGVGITIDAGDQVQVSEIELRMAVAGADVEIYSAPGEAAAPEDLEGWGAPIASAQDIGTRERIQVEAGAPSQQFLIWITKLPAADDGSGFRAEIADIRLLE
jgi:hypothetical protein